MGNECGVCDTVHNTKVDQVYPIDESDPPKANNSHENSAIENL